MSGERARDIAALIDFIESRRHLPFAWGRHANDCVSFAAYAVKAMTGRHRLDEDGLRLRWSSKRGALRLLGREGGLERAVDRRFGRVPPARARRGDIAGVADPLLGIRLMIVEGETLVGPGEAGLVWMPRSAMVMAWSATAKPIGPDALDV